MKNLLAVAMLLLCIRSISVSQSVIEYVSFDNYINQGDNDFINYFTGTTGFAQITTNGIAGGCLTTPLTESWGNDNAIYCSKYINAANYTSTTRSAFRYDTTQLNTINFDRAVSIFLRPSADFNHYVIASITSNKQIQIVSYFAANNPYLVNLIHNHWYDFILTTSFTTPAPVYQVAVNVQVNDLGITGQMPPIPVGNSSIGFNDSLLYVDPAVQVSFSATQWGGAKYLDNFRFQGVKSADSCNATTGIAIFPENEISLFTNGNTLQISNGHPGMELRLFSVTGQLVYHDLLPTGHSAITFDDLESGLYIAEVSGGNNAYRHTAKILIVD